MIKPTFCSFYLFVRVFSLQSNDVHENFIVHLCTICPYLNVEFMLTCKSSNTKHLLVYPKFLKVENVRHCIDVASVSTESSLHISILLPFCVLGSGDSVP